LLGSSAGAAAASLAGLINGPALLRVSDIESTGFNTLIDVVSVNVLLLPLVEMWLSSTSMQNM
jgi:hypothetical protein